MRNNLLVSLALFLLLLGSPDGTSTRNVHGQEKTEPRVCPDIPGHTSATHRFRRQGETIEIPIRGEGVPASVVDCEPVSLDLQWSNGRNNGSNFSVILLDGDNRPISRKSIVGFQNGLAQFPLSSFGTQAIRGASMGMISVPTTVTVQAVAPFAAPAGLSYRVVRVPRVSRARTNEEGNSSLGAESENSGNEIVSIRRTSRLIGSSSLPVIQIELRTNRPFPVRDVPLQLQIGGRIFVDELSGEYTGRKLTLSLTPEMYAALKDGDEILASFGDVKGSSPNDVWRFGTLKKPGIVQP
ncbi:MAG TPA: hypothetical protein VJU86_10680 [Pyrinomonadaceae bacterium]|nr:hypothetical protein [Pyrinomonadaceae bacterium]